MNPNHKDQMLSNLSKKSLARFPLIYNYIAGGASILALIGAPRLFDDEVTIASIYAISLCILVFTLMAFIAIRESQALHRYAQALFHIHYVCHSVRDFTKQAKDDINHIENLESECRKILDAISYCFSTLHCKLCSAELIELKKTKEKDRDIYHLKVFSTDAVTNQRNICFEEERHDLDKNTDCDEVFRFRNGNYRYYLCNDLVAKAKIDEFKSTFKIKGRKLVFSQFLTKLRGWPYPFRSSVVIPIRCLDSKKAPKEGEAGDEYGDFWGFLRISCDSRNIFDLRHTPELGGIFGDTLYTLFSTSDYLLEK